MTTGPSGGVLALRRQVERHHALTLYRQESSSRADTNELYAAMFTPWGRNIPLDEALRGDFGESEQLPPPQRRPRPSRYGTWSHISLWIAIVGVLLFVVGLLLAIDYHNDAAIPAWAADFTAFGRIGLSVVVVGLAGAVVFHSLARNLRGSSPFAGLGRSFFLTLPIVGFILLVVGAIFSPGHQSERGVGEAALGHVCGNVIILGLITMLAGPVILSLRRLAK